MSLQTLESSRATIRVVVSGELVPDDVRRIAEALDAAPRGVRVEVDLREARGCQAHALLLFAQQIAETGASASFLGLTESDHRLLRYLGHDVPEPAGDRRT